ncbi:hypothetical protein AX17_004392 [Amanita inopinata Kibby_2008]|nr:hypothetical protein AX17_004392 [Amanita inopinata Kibby_2008]
MNYNARDTSSIRYTTTTVITYPTSPTFPSSSQSIPVAAVIGGVIGGAVFAGLMTVGWILWGKFIKKRQAEESLQLASHLQTLRNTHRNAFISGRQVDSYRPLASHPPVPTIKFAIAQMNNGDMNPRTTVGTYRRTQLELEATRSRSQNEKSLISSVPKRLRPIPILKASAFGVVKNSALTVPMVPPTERTYYELSINSTDSTYTTASEEVDSARVPADMFMPVHSYNANPTEDHEEPFKDDSLEQIRSNLATPSPETQQHSISTYATAPSFLADGM